MNKYLAETDDKAALRLMAADYAAADSQECRAAVLSASRDRMDLIATGTLPEVHREAAALQTWCMIQAMQR